MDKAPVHLKPHSAAWFDGVMSVFDLAPHHRFQQSLWKG